MLLLTAAEAVLFTTQALELEADIDGVPQHHAANRYGLAAVQFAVVDGAKYFGIAVIVLAAVAAV